MEDYSNQDEYGFEDNETSKPFTVKSAAVKYGVYLGIVSVVLALIQFLFLSDSQDRTTGTIMWVTGIAISVIAIVFAHNEFKRYNEYMSYSEGLGIGVMLSVISGLISGVFGVIYRTVIDPEFTKRSLEQARKVYEGMEMSDAQIEQTMAYVEKFSSPGIVFLIGLFFAALGGLILSLIISAITQKKRPMFE